MRSAHWLALPMLHHLKHQVPLTLTVDASDIAVGGVMEQLVDGQLQPLAFLWQKIAENGNQM